MNKRKVDDILYNVSDTDDNPTIAQIPANEMTPWTRHSDMIIKYSLFTVGYVACVENS